MKHIMDEQKLLDLKKEIKEAGDKATELKGQQKSLMSQLKKDWNCDTTKQAEEEVEELGKEITQLNTKIDEGVKELEEKYEL